MSDAPRPIVHVVDDDAAVRDALVLLLASEGHAVAQYENAAALLQSELHPLGCIITDYQMPEMNGLELQAALSRQGKLLPVILMTGHAEVPLAVQAMRSGAADFLEKPIADADLLTAVARALETNRGMVAAHARAADAQSRLAVLTPREREVLDLLVEGMSNKEVARALGTSPRTIDVHRARIIQKTSAESLPALVRLVAAARR